MTKPKRGEGSLKPVAAVTFLNYAARGLITPFVSLYLVEIGFSGVEIGLVLSASAAVRLIIPSLLNVIADRLRRHRQLFYLLVSGNALATIGLVLTASTKIGAGSMVVIRDSLDMPSASLLSQLTITKLTRQGRDIYGQMRAWGSLGWAVTTMISGAIFASGGYALLFIVASLLNILSIPFGRYLPQRTTEHSDTEDDTPTAPMKRQAGFYILMTSWFLFFIGMSAIAGFLYVYFQQDLGASNAMIGVLSSVAALAEIPSMIFIDRWLKRFNIRFTLIIGMLGMAGLWVVFTLLTDTALLIPLMIIRGTFYTFQSVANTLLVSRISHPANAATNQAIAQVSIPSLALLVTGPIAGWIFDNIGARTLFQVGALIVLLGVILLIAARRQLARTPVTGNAAV